MTGIPDRSGGSGTVPSAKRSSSSRSRGVAALAYLLSGATLVPSQPAFAQAVGSTVINPLTGFSEIVVGVDPANPGKVLTDANNAIGSIKPYVVREEVAGDAAR